MSILSEKFIDRVTMYDLAERYGFQINKGGFMKCPFHQDDSPSLKIYEGKGGFYCFGCNKGGTVIQFVMDYFKISYMDALKKLDSDFRLNILSADEDQEVTRRYKNREAILKLKKKKKKLDIDVLVALHCKYHLSVKFDKPMSDSFCEALYHITDVEYKIECFEEGRV